MAQQKGEQVMGPRVLDISWGTIAKIAIAGVVAYVFFLVRDVFVWLLFGLVISVLFEPAIHMLQKAKIPRSVGVVLVYSVVFGFVAFSIYGMAPIFVNEMKRFSQVFPQYVDTATPFLSSVGLDASAATNGIFDALAGNAQKAGSNVLNGLFVVFGGIFSTIFVVSVAIFLSIEEKSVERMIMLLFPKKYEAFALNLWERSQWKVSGWFLSRVVSSLFVGVATYFALLIFDAPYPISFALLATTLNFIPIIGPLIAGALIALIVALDAPLKALFVSLSYFLIQQIEGNVLSPILTKKFVGLSPVLMLVAVTVGGQLWGIAGAVLAIPLAGILFEFIRDFFRKQKEEREKAVIL